MKYDDASWHYGADDFGDLPEIHGYTHTGTFLAWALLNGLSGELHLEEIDKLTKREVTPAEFFQNNCDGKFTEEDLNKLGNNFAKDFFEEKYFVVYADAADPNDEFDNIYEIPSNWATYDKVALEIEKFFNKWREKNL